MKGLVLALLSFLYLNALFTFENVPSTPAMRLVPKLSVEILILVLALALVRTSGRRLTRLARGCLALVLFLAFLIRYVETTALGVLGRDFDVYGDFPHLHRVFAMFLEAMTPALGVAVVSVVLLIAALALALNWAAVGALDRVLESPSPRGVVLLGALVGTGAFALAPGGLFSTPVSSMVARQVANVRGGDRAKLAAAAIELPPQTLESSLGRLGGADVLLVFVESYGIALVEDPRLFEAMEPRYRELEARLRERGFFFSSSQILSPTFGGGSWRAHASLLSGFQADSEQLYNALLASKRKTLVHVLKERGYRTIAAEPGIKWYWPDGLFYGFDCIYDFDALDYRGPPMGWWKIPDQFTLYKVYRAEIEEEARKPVFAKFSLIMTHIPYYPVPEYVSDWRRFDDRTAFRTGLKSVAHDAYRDLMELSRWYLAAVGYELDVLEGFLSTYTPENSLVIIVGDHQPPKLATHDDDSWAVPMHVLSKREDLVRAFDALGFEDGLVPRRESSLRMADFLEGFLRIYDHRAAE
jgi:hypothetical protein